MSVKIFWGGTTRPLHISLGGRTLFFEFNDCTGLELHDSDSFFIPSLQSPEAIRYFADWLAELVESGPAEGRHTLNIPGFYADLAGENYYDESGALIHDATLLSHDFFVRDNAVLLAAEAWSDLLEADGDDPDGFGAWIDFAEMPLFHRVLHALADAWELGLPWEFLPEEIV